MAEQLDFLAFVPEAADIRPATDWKSDFYSWQLFRWVRKDRRFCQIWQEPRGAVYIGHADEASDDVWLHGRLLRNLCSFGADLHRAAHHLEAGSKNITEEWWARYLAKGVCEIHGDLMHKWLDGGDTRRCKHCGKVERRHVELVEQVTWIEA